MKRPLLILFSLFYTFIVSAQNEVSTYAVVVGVAKYSGISSLNYTKDDAYRFYAHLKSVEGGSLPEQNIVLLLDEQATNLKIFSSLRVLLAKADINDRVIFYFSGHGTPGAFLPYDYNGYTNKLLHNDISSVFASCKAKYKVCIADACYSGGLNKNGGLVQESIDVFNENLEKSVGGYALLMSSSAGETSIESDYKSQGVFSFFLIKGLTGYANQDEDKIVTITELFNYVKKNVIDYTKGKQNPVLNGNFNENMPISVIYSKISNSTSDVANSSLPNSIEPYNPSSNNSELSTISIAINDIKSYTEVFVDDKFIGKVEYLFPNSKHPGCEAKGTLNAEVAAGAHTIKIISNGKVLRQSNITVGKNECHLKTFVFIFEDSNIPGLSSENNSCKLSFRTYINSTVKVWVDDNYIGIAPYRNRDEKIECDTKGILSTNLIEGWHTVFAKDVNTDKHWSFRVYLVKGDCTLHNLKYASRNFEYKFD